MLFHRVTRCLHKLALALLVLTSAPTRVQAAELPLWEAGVGVGGLQLPHYRGSDQRYGLLLPVPYLVYRGPFLKADREGIRTTLLDSDKLELSLSLNGTLPVNSADNTARRGMPSLRPLVEIGPNINLGLPSPIANSRLRLRFPLRSAVTVEASPRHIGWLFAPNLLFELPDPPGLPGWRLSMQAGPYFQSRRYNEHFYGVSAADATLMRPAYSADAGYAGSQLTLALSRRFSRYWVGGFVRLDTLKGATFQDSPLVRDERAIAAGFAVIWVFGQSARVVEAID